MLGACPARGRPCPRPCDVVAQVEPGILHPRSRHMAPPSGPGPPAPPPPAAFDLGVLSVCLVLGRVLCFHKGYCVIFSTKQLQKKKVHSSFYYIILGGGTSVCQSLVFGHWWFLVLREQE